MSSGTPRAPPKSCKQVNKPVTTATAQEVLEDENGIRVTREDYAKPVPLDALIANGEVNEASAQSARIKRVERKGGLPEELIPVLERMSGLRD